MRGSIGAIEFRKLMDRLGPFESEPCLAVAVSGGADSMALVLLADRWVRRKRGRLVALTVDHGLRGGSRAEAREAQRRLKSRNIECRLLTWRGAKPVTGIQAAARDSRYSLMADWCRRHGFLHLLVAHHLADQAETFLHRLSRSSGSDGLAGMAACRELADVRLLRPCLDIPRARLRSVLAKEKMEWAEDPSNSNVAFARVRLRSLMPSLATEGLDAASLAGTAHRMAEIRGTLEAQTAQLLARHATLYAEGYAELDHSALQRLDRELASRVMAALLVCVGGAVYSPRQARLSNLIDMLLSDSRPQGRTLGGCRVMYRGDMLLIIREAGRCASATVCEGTRSLWDNRYLIDLRPPEKGKPRRCTIRALGDAGWSAIRQADLPPRAFRIPAVARAALPALYMGRTVAAVPHLGFVGEISNASSVLRADVRFMPSKSASSVVFPVA